MGVSGGSLKDSGKSKRFYLAALKDRSKYTKCSCQYTGNRDSFMGGLIHLCSSVLYQTQSASVNNRAMQAKVVLPALGLDARRSVAT